MILNATDKILVRMPAQRSRRFELELQSIKNPVRVFDCSQDDGSNVLIGNCMDDTEPHFPRVRDASVADITYIRHQLVKRPPQ